MAMPFRELDDISSNEPPSPSLVAAREEAPSLTDLPPQHEVNERCARALHALGIANFSLKGIQVAAKMLDNNRMREEFQRIGEARPISYGPAKPC